MVSTDKFNLLHSYIFRKKNVIMGDTFSYKDRSILYICQNGTSGYANAAKGYIYDYIGKNIPIKTQYFNCSDEVNENDRFHQYLNSCTSNDIKYNTIIVHSTPDIWTDVIKNAPNINLENKTIIGRTVWEFEKLLPEWVININTSIVDIVSVPTEWNKQCFINSGVIKPIIVEPHVYVDYPYKKVGLTVLSKKSILISKKEDISNINYNEYYKFYCIGQFIERKGIAETIDAFCNTFTSKDKVLLFIKTFKLNYSKEEQNKCLLEIVKIAEKYDHASIIYIKDSLNYDEIKSLHDIGDCYFHLTRTEGFCLGAFDAVNNNKTVIITGYGGHKEYLGSDYKGLVNYKFNQLSINESVFFQFKLDNTYKWAIPDKNHASKLLRSNFESNFNFGFIKISNKECIKYIGQTGTCGYATAAKGYLADYVKKNIPVTWQQLKFDNSSNDLNYYVDILAESSVNKKFNFYDTVILHSTPDLWEGFIKENQKIPNIIGYCTWETNKLPLKWVEYINLVKEVWVPSQFNKQSFIDSGVNIDIKVVPHIWHPQNLLDKSHIKIYDFNKNEIPTDKFTFYSIGELNFRKGIEDLIKVFDKFNEKYRNTQLILKLHYKDYSQKNKEYCISKIQKLTDKIGTSIFIIFENLTNQQILALHSFGDCYVSLNKGEGFGLTIFDAFNYGKKVITTGYGGQLDFLGKDYTGLVDYKIDKVTGMDSFSTNYSNDQLWAYPDLDHVYVLMEKFYKNI
jgi:glycosyltransferase involved in cell wall biosynthesis